MTHVNMKKHRYEYLRALKPMNALLYGKSGYLVLTVLRLDSCAQDKIAGAARFRMSIL